jgi:hypothetical protein
MRHLTAPADLELLGAMTTVFVNNLQGMETAPVFQKYGLVNLDPQQWYPAYKFMDAMNELAVHGNISSNMLAIGMEVGKITPLPPEMSNPTLGEVLMMWNDLYHAVHRGHKGNIGKIVCEKVSDSHYTTSHTDLYPDDFSYGIVYGFARRFLPHGSRFRVYYENEAKRRDLGTADITVIHVQWN